MAKLGEVCKLNMGQSPDSSSYNDTGDGIPFFQGNADFGEVHPNIRVWCNAPTKIAHPGEILISVRAPIGAMNIADCECCIGRGLASISVDESICTTKYLWYDLFTKIEELNSKGTGSTFKAINKKTLEETEVQLRDMDEQRKISETLDKITQLVSLRKQQLAKLDELVKARFVEMFDAISPKKCASKIGECAEVLGGYAFKSDCFSNQGVPVVRIGNINDGRIDIDYNTCYAEEFWNKNPRFQARKYDILMAMSGATTGKVGIYKSDERLLINQRVACIRARDDESAIFLFACLQLPWMYNLVQEASAGCAQPNISGKQIETMPVPKPETSKVHQFAAFVERVDQQKQTIQQSLEKLELMKKVLMQEYFG